MSQKGVDSYVIESLFRNREQKLSRLHITKDYRIILTDYDNMEIVMTPLPKALFLLYQKHPNGIMFSYLSDYREELMDIYKKVKGMSSETYSIRQSVDDVTNPLKNSVNEKCSRIREAFVSRFDDHLARYYYVDGERGEVKKIDLPREMVTWE